MIMHFKENSLAQISYFFTTNPVFREIKSYLCWIYLLLTFFEPSNSSDTSIDRDSVQFSSVLVAEIVILAYFVLDMILRTQYMYIAGKRLGFWKIFLDELFLIHFICEFMMIFDAILFYSIYPAKYFRFGRIFRAVKAVMESKDVYRTTMATLRCYPQIIDLAVLLMMITFFYAVFGARFLDPDTPGITRESDFSKLNEGTESIYFLITLANYPGVLRPYMKYKSINVLYFYPFLVFTVLIILPLPVAIMFEAFKINRGKILLKDRLHQKEGLFMSFMCIDHQRKGYINLEQWFLFINACYNGNQDNRKAKRVFEVLDSRDIGYMNCEIFFQACELVRSLTGFTKEAKRCVILGKARQCVVKYTTLDKIVNSKCFNTLMFIIIILNMILLALQLMPFNDSVLKIFDLIDDVFMYIFCLEAVIKIIGMGIREYFNDNWNKFDFILVVLSLLLNITMSVLRVAKKLITSSVVKLDEDNKWNSCIQKAKKRRIIKWIFAPLNTLSRIRIIILKALKCVTIFRRITSVMIIIFYIYAVVGTELLHYSQSDYDRINASDPNLAYFEGGIYGNFTTFKDSIFALFQILTESSWHLVVLYQELFNGFWLPFIVLLSFHMFITFIMRSILLGLTWEVFAVVSQNEEFQAESAQVEAKSKYVIEEDKSFNDRLPINYRIMKPQNSTNYYEVKNSVKEQIEMDKIYKELYASGNSTDKDLKSLKRFMKRISSFADLRPKLSKAFLGTQNEASVPSNPLLKRSIDIDSNLRGRPSRSLSQSNCNTAQTSYNTDILLLGHELTSESSECIENCTELSQPDSSQNKRYDIYHENDINFSLVDSSKGTKKNEHSFGKFKSRRSSNAKFKRPSLLRRVGAMNLGSVALKTLSNSHEEEMMQLNGDYILNRALLKDHDVKELRTKEMQHVLSKLCIIHLGTDEHGRKIVQVYRKPEVKEVTEEECNSLIVNFISKIRVTIETKPLLDILDEVQQKIEKMCPFGSMVKIFYKLEGQGSHKNVWFLPNRDDVETGIVKLENFMNFFEEATQNKKPIVIKDVFTTDYQQEIPSYTIINGSKIQHGENLSEIWYNSMSKLSEVTKSNLDKLPPEFYEWHCFAIPLKKSQYDKTSPHHFDHIINQENPDNSLDLSLSSIQSYEEEKPMLVRQAMIMLYLCKRRKFSNSNTHLDLDTGNYRFSFNWRESKTERHISKAALIKVLHNIKDSFNAHNEKILYHLNEWAQFTSLAHLFASTLDDPAIKRSHSL